MAVKISSECGSLWRRWNPHIHAPGTLLNDQFNGDWEAYLTAIEHATPTVSVLGITDYLGIEGYKEICRRHHDGRLPDVEMIFPNVEFRLTVETDKLKGINLHLLFCPDDEDHVVQIERALTALSFEYSGQTYRCTGADLILLGRAHDATLATDVAAHQAGANQFKVELSHLRELFRSNSWVAKNCIVAVAASNNDGTAGLQKDASFAALRKEIERFAHVIFSSTPKTREFWLGKIPSDDLEKLELEYGGRKPCLHGCDAHSILKVCNPHEKRFCWIKGAPTFESIQQALLEPEERVSIGPTAPDRHNASQCISSIDCRDTPWLSNSSIPLNPGLVSIIGARGSGKTALADLLAIGADVISPLTLSSSFIHRASHPTNHLAKAIVQLNWGDKTSIARWVNSEQERGIETVRYLSQQFVEQLCSAEGLAIELRKEIERVIFEAIPQGDRLMADTFAELADIHLQPIRGRRDSAKKEIESTSTQVNKEDALHSRISKIENEEKRIKAIVKSDKAAMKLLIPKGQEARATRLVELDTALAQQTNEFEKLNRKKLLLNEFVAEVRTIRTVSSPNRLSDLQNRFADAELSSEQWMEFRMVFAGDVDTILAARFEATEKEIVLIKEGKSDQAKDLSETQIDQWPLMQLKAERDKVSKEVGIDGQKKLRYSALQEKIGKNEKIIQNLSEELANAKGAATRRKALIEKRRDLYSDVFQALLDEKARLEELYAPLQDSLKDASGSIKRLRLAVSRQVDLDAWVVAGESLLDLRLESKLRGHGSLKLLAEENLAPAWRSGTAEEVGAAMHTFIQMMLPEIRKSKPSEISSSEESEWLQRVAKWIYSTDHIEMRYGITYDNIPIEQLSPGTRGIVLLLLYLVIDKQDLRPLVIDQPEENLDPKSVFEELVPHFREARRRRQIIIVTHNANLVVNTDADQVIVASSEPSPSGGLPTISYACGALEDEGIRAKVCEILEGGQRAFRDRERRYRLQRQL